MHLLCFFLLCQARGPSWLVPWAKDFLCVLLRFAVEPQGSFFATQEYEAFFDNLVDRLPIDEETYDYIVVGGGAGGCAVADVLSQSACMWPLLAAVFACKGHPCNVQGSRELRKHHELLSVFEMQAGRRSSCWSVEWNAH